MPGAGVNLEIGEGVDLKIGGSVGFTGLEVGDGTGGLVGTTLLVGAGVNCARDLDFTCPTFSSLTSSTFSIILSSNSQSNNEAEPDESVRNATAENSKRIIDCKAKNRLRSGTRT